MGWLNNLFRRSQPAAEESIQPAAAPPVPRVPARVGNVQGIGCRERQEDSFALVNPSNLNAELFAIVCDGMGGMEDGKGASVEAVDAFVQLFQALRDDGTIPQQLAEGARAISDAIFQRFNGRSGTTAVAVRVFQNQLYWVSVGDSAMYLARNGGVFQLNREHNHLNELYLNELGRDPIDKERAETDEDARRLSSFVGIDCIREVDCNLRPFQLLPGDVLLLCSDGISGVLTPPELLEAMRLPPDEGCHLLETLVLEKNVSDQDNYTGILIAI